MREHELTRVKEIDPTEYYPSWRYTREELEQVPNFSQFDVFIIGWFVGWWKKCEGSAKQQWRIHSIIPASA